MITGASLGIDRFTEIIPVTARGLHLVLTARSSDKLRHLAKELSGKSPAVTADMTKPKDIDRILQGASRWREAADPRG
jgi:short-subunit dehydrogenase